MPETTTAGLVGDAARAGVGVAAFNVITLEHAEGIVTGAQVAGRPVILQVSQNAVAYHGGSPAPLAAALHAIAAAAQVPVALHLDHVEDLDLLAAGVEAGFGSVMVDAGRLPYEENVAETAGAARRLRSLGIFVEAELGHVGGKAAQVTSAHQPGIRTDPGQAAQFVAATGVDALAVAVGSSHAMTARTASLDIDLIGALRAALPVPLVLHGSSGVPDEVLREAVRAGITKVNVGTALNVAFTGAVRASLGPVGSPGGVDPRRYLGAGRTAVRDVVAHLLDVVCG